MQNLATPLNIKPKEDPFASVPFVKDMTQHSLRVLVRKLWGNFQKLSNELV